MKDWIKKFLNQIKSLWGKWSTVQKVIFIGITAVAILAIVLLLTFSSRPTAVPLITTPITDEEKLQRISSRLDQEGGGVGARLRYRWRVEPEQVPLESRAAGD